MILLPRKGLPKAIIKKYGITKKAWQVYRGRSRTSRTRRSSPTSRRTGVRRLARRRYTRKRRRRKRTITVLPIVGGVAGVFIPPVTAGGGISPFDNLKTGQFNWAFEGIVENYTGFNIFTGDWNIANAKGLVAAVVGVAAHKVLNMLGLNRAFANLPSPLNKLRL